MKTEHLTFDERERLAYQEGDYANAKLLALAMEAPNEAALFDEEMACTEALNGIRALFQNNSFSNHSTKAELLELLRAIQQEVIV